MCDPRSPEHVHALLQQSVGAGGVGAQEQQAAQRALVETCEGAEDISGYVQSLLQVAVHSSGAQAESRLLAVISLKNVVDRRWLQRGASRVVGDAEKATLRQFLLSTACFLEPDRKVAVQFAALSAKVAFKDWPVNWPVLLPGLFHVATTPLPESGDLAWLQQARAMSTLKAVLEDLSAKSLPASKSQLASVCAEMFAPLADAWQLLVAQLATFLHQTHESILASRQQLVFLSIPRNPQMEQLAAHTSVATAVLVRVVEKAFVGLTRQQHALPKPLVRFFEALIAHLPSFSAFLRDGSRILSDNIDHAEDEADEWGYEFDAEGAAAAAAAEGAASGAEVLLSGLKALIPSIKTIVRDASALLPVLQKEHPLEIVPFLDGFLPFFHEQLAIEFTPSEASAAGEAKSTAQLQPLFIAGVLFISNTLHAREYSVEHASSDALRTKDVLRQKLTFQIDAAQRGDVNLGESGIDSDAISAWSSAMASQGSATKLAFFSRERIQALLELALHRLLRYGAVELEEWLESPEQFIQGQDGLREGDSIKTATEMLVVGLVDDKVCPCADIAVQILVGHLQNLPSQLEAVRCGGSESCNLSVLFWDAVYLSTGLANFALGEKINAKEWLVNVIGPMLAASLTSPAAGSLQPGGQQLLRARLLWLVKSWLYNFDATVLEQLVGFLVALLEPAAQSDMVVSLEAMRLIEYVIDSPHCSAELVEPVLLRLFESLCALTLRLEDCELQATVVVLLGKLVDCAGTSRIVPLLQPLAVHLCSLWTASQEQSPVRTSIIDCVTQMVSTVGPSSPALHNVAGPILTFALSGSEESSYLVKEALELLLAVVQNCPPAYFSNSLDVLLPAALACVFGGECNYSDADVKDLHKTMYICEAYCVLRGPHCLFTCGAVMGRTFNQLVGHVWAKTADHVVRPLEVLFLSCPADAGRFLSETGLLLSLLRICAAATPQLMYILGDDHRQQDLALVAYLSLVARVLLCEPALLGPAMQALCAEIAPRLPPIDATALDPNELLKNILRLLLDKFDAAGNGTSGVWRRKLWALALLSLYPQTELVRDWFPEVCDKAVDVISEESLSESAAKHKGLVRAIAGLDGMDAEGFGDGADDGYAGGGSDVDDDDDVEGGAWDDHEYGDGAGIEARAPIVDAYESMLQADVVMATNVKAALDAKVAAMQTNP